MENNFIIKELDNENIVVYEKEFPRVFIKKSREWHLFVTKEICITKNKSSAIRAAQNVIKLINRGGKMKCKACGKKLTAQDYKYICLNCAEEHETKPYGRYCEGCGADLFNEEHKKGC